MGEPEKTPARQKEQKDLWDIFQIIMQALTALAAAAIALFIGLSQQKNTQTTLQITQSQVKVSLVPLLASQEPMQRAMALSLAHALAKDDKDYILDIVKTVGASDPNEEVQQRVRLILGNLSQSEQGDVKQKAEKAADQFDLMDELRTQGLLNKLRAARSYMEVGSPDGDEQALKLYHEVIGRLSYGALKKLDQSLLRIAQEQEQSGSKDHAARTYRVLFQQYAG